MTLATTSTTVSMRAFRARLRRYHAAFGARIIFGRWADHIELADGRIAVLGVRGDGTGMTLEAYARQVGVLRAGEVLDTTPRCSRCKSRTPARRMQWVWTDGEPTMVPVEPARYHRQCERCVEWSRASRRDPTLCIDCRRPKDERARTVDGRYRLSRCSDCHAVKLNREYRARQIDGATNPLSPWFGAPMGQAYDR